MNSQLNNHSSLGFALRAFLYTIEMPAKKNDIEVAIGKSIGEIDIVDARNYLLSRDINTKLFIIAIK